nr:MAG TPA: hypothetical protein [Caudoviricetes sp.]
MQKLQRTPRAARKKGKISTTPRSGIPLTDKPERT